MNEDVWLYNVDKEVNIDFNPECKGTSYIVFKIIPLCLDHRHLSLFPSSKNKCCIKDI